MAEDGLRIQEVEGPIWDGSGAERFRRGHRLADLVAKFGGYRGEMINPFNDERVAVSLEEWRDRDPESTYLMISFVSNSPPSGST